MIEIPSLRVLSEEEIEWNEWIYIDNDIQKNIEMDDVCNNVNKNGYRKAWENIEMEGGMEYGWGDGWWTCWDFTVLKHGDVFEQAGNTNWNQKFVLLRIRCTNRSKEKKINNGYIDDAKKQIQRGVAWIECKFRGPNSGEMTKQKQNYKSLTHAREENFLTRWRHLKSRETCTFEMNWSDGIRLAHSTHWVAPYEFRIFQTHNMILWFVPETW